MKKLQIALAVMALGGALAAAPASAITITNGDLTNAQWNGIDWDSAGTAFTSGFTGTPGNTFTLTYFAWATALKLNGSTLFTPHLDNNADGHPAAPGTYEYTVVGQLTEQIVSCDGSGKCSFNILGGTFQTYYDTTPDANSTSGSLGTGFTDGAMLYGGIIPAQSGGTFDTNAANTVNAFTVTNQITQTNPLYIHPNLDHGVTTGTLQLGVSGTAYTNPGGFSGVPFVPGQVVLQADGNSIVFPATVPEPGTLLLLGAAMLGFAAVRRKSE